MSIDWPSLLPLSPLVCCLFGSGMRVCENLLSGLGQDRRKKEEEGSFIEGATVSNYIHTQDE
jgi:hypothetical protein